MKPINIFSLLLFVGIWSCKNNETIYDASGVFEADEVIVSAEAMGKIISLKVNEGDQLKMGEVVGQIGDINLNLQKGQIEASIKALYDKKTSADPQIGILKQQILNQEANVGIQNEQLQVLIREQKRIENLVSKDAVPAKQLDDINGQIAILKQQIIALQSVVGTLKQQIKSAQASANLQNRAVLSEQKPLEQRAAQIEDQIDKSAIENPIDGTVLAKYMEENEIATIGKPIYKIAKTDQLILRAYVTGNQLNQIKTNQKVKITTGGGETIKSTTGTITWIASKAEFTPKTIQTVDERSNLVYAIKVLVPNDGYLKIGMYGDVNFAL